MAPATRTRRECIATKQTNGSTEKHSNEKASEVKPTRLHGSLTPLTHSSQEFEQSKYFDPNNSKMDDGIKNSVNKNYNTGHSVAQKNIRHNLHVQYYADGSNHLMKSLYHRTLGCSSSQFLKKYIKPPVLSHLSKLSVYTTHASFRRRTTSMAWHPTHPSTISVGSKGGDIMLWDYEAKNNILFIPGIGVGGAILAMKFHPFKRDHLYTASADGKVCLRDFTGRSNRSLLDTMNWDQWFCSVDVSSVDNKLVAGDTQGNVTLMSRDGEKIWCSRLHRNKVTHAEFSTIQSSLLATTSNDGFLKLWDVRFLKDKSSALVLHRHNKAVNSAVFSLQSGTRLLTTDQGNEIRVYKAPLWNLERSMSHPHRQYQHLTPIKAHWHPLVDIAMVGRYPDEKFPGFLPGERRSVDFFDPDTGNLIYQLSEYGIVGIISLNQFNKTGDVLASCMGSNVLLWKNRDIIKASQDDTVEDCPVVTSRVLGNSYQPSSRHKSHLSKQMVKRLGHKEPERK